MARSKFVKDDAMDKQANPPDLSALIAENQRMRSAIVEAVRKLERDMPDEWWGADWSEQDAHMTNGDCNDIACLLGDALTAPPAPAAQPEPVRKLDPTELVEGRMYRMKHFGLAKYVGLDHYMGETTAKFDSIEYGRKYERLDNLVLDAPTPRGDA